MFRKSLCSWSLVLLFSLIPAASAQSFEEFDALLERGEIRGLVKEVAKHSGLSRELLAVEADVARGFLHRAWAAHGRLKSAALNPEQLVRYRLLSAELSSWQKNKREAQTQIQRASQALDEAVLNETRRQRYRQRLKLLSAELNIPRTRARSSELFEQQMGELRSDPKAQAWLLGSSKLRDYACRREPEKAEGLLRDFEAESKALDSPGLLLDVRLELSRELARLGKTQEALKLARWCFQEASQRGEYLRTDHGLTLLYSVSNAAEPSLAEAEKTLESLADDWARLKFLATLCFRYEDLSLLENYHQQAKALGDSYHLAQSSRLLSEAKVVDSPDEALQYLKLTYAATRANPKADRKSRSRREALVNDVLKNFIKFGVRTGREDSSLEWLKLIQSSQREAGKRALLFLGRAELVESAILELNLPGFFSAFESPMVEKISDDDATNFLITYLTLDERVWEVFLNPYSLSLWAPFEESVLSRELLAELKTPVLTELLGRKVSPRFPDPDREILKAVLLSDLGRVAEAQQVFKEAKSIVATSPRNREFIEITLDHAEIVLTYRGGDKERAQRLAETFVSGCEHRSAKDSKLQWQSEFSRRLLASLLKSQGDTETALVTLGDTDVTEPSNQLLKVELLVELEKHPEALKLIDELLVMPRLRYSRVSRDTVWRRLTRLKATLLSKLGEHKQAEQLFAILDTPHPFDPLYRSIVLLEWADARKRAGKDHAALRKSASREFEKTLGALHPRVREVIATRKNLSQRFDS